VKAGTIVIVALPAMRPTGREQEGTRPCVVIANPDNVGRTRYPVLYVAPMTTAYGGWANSQPKLYPTLTNGMGGINADSVVLLDQVRTVDVSRVRGSTGVLSDSELEPIRAGLRAVFAEVLELGK
jgi:mRNA interferase MazF